MSFIRALIRPMETGIFHGIKNFSVIRRSLGLPPHSGTRSGVMEHATFFAWCAKNLLLQDGTLQCDPPSSKMLFVRCT